MYARTHAHTLMYYTLLSLSYNPGLKVVKRLMKTVLHAEKLVESYPVKSRSQQIIDNEYSIDRSCVDFSSFIEQ